MPTSSATVSRNLVCRPPTDPPSSLTISPDLKRVMGGNPKVKCSLIAIGEGAEAAWLPKALPGRAFAVRDTTDIATTLRTILSEIATTGL